MSWLSWFRRVPGHFLFPFADKPPKPGLMKGL
jgi:hypothetical protein